MRVPKYDKNGERKDLTKKELLEISKTWGAKAKNHWPKEKVRDAVRERIRECYLRTKVGMIVYCKWEKVSDAELQNIPLMRLIYDIEIPGTHPEWELPEWYKTLNGEHE